ncbi:MAG: hypothetical protein K2N73_03960 [Lachnospiraceae bacterium]|nr:hypothetical protein [Lachnospiraceae bacterium]
MHIKNRITHRAVIPMLDLLLLYQTGQADNAGLKDLTIGEVSVLDMDSCKDNLPSVF